VLNKEDCVLKTLEECMYKNDWSKWKDALKTELNSLEKRNIFGHIVLTPKYINHVEYKWVFIININEKNEIMRYKARLAVKKFT
jgi:hypothetical protein